MNLFKLIILRKKAIKQKFNILLLFIPFSISIYAQDTLRLKNLTIEQLMNVEVISASKKTEKSIDAPSNVTVLSAQVLKEWGSRDLKDVLKRVIGYQVIVDRDEWIFAARGNVSDNNQKYLILIDGVRVNSIENFGPGNIIEMPNNLSNVKQIEIIRGPGSVVWGADALAGVINIITKNGGDLENPVNASLSLGQDSYATADFQIGQKMSNKIEYTISGVFGMQEGREFQQSASSSQPLLDNPTNYPFPPYGTYNSKFDNFKPGYLLHTKFKIGDFNIKTMNFESTVFNRHIESDKGRSNYKISNKDFLEAEFYKEINNLILSVRLGTLRNIVENTPIEQESNIKNQSSYSWKDRGINFSTDAIKPILKNKATISAGVNYIFTRLGPNYRLDNFNADSIKNKTIGYWQDKYMEDHQIGGYLMTTWSPVKKVKFILGSRADVNNQRGSDHYDFSPRAAIILYPYKSGTYKLIFNKGYLRPANYQLSVKVKSEIMNQIELILNQQIGSALLTFNAFWQELKGFILIASDQKNHLNAGDYTSKGLEIEINAPLKEYLSVWANGTYIIPEGKNFTDKIPYDYRRIDLNGRILSYSPTNANAGFTYHLLDKKIFMSPACRFLAATTYRSIPATVIPNADNSLTYIDSPSYYSKTPNFIYIDFNIGFEPNQKIGIYFYIDNLTNIRSQTHMSVWNGTVEQYGRFIMGKIRIHF